METTKVLGDVFITTTFIGYHRWVDAPDDVAFLRDYHRHVFHVKMFWTITHAERQIEFISQKRLVDAWLNAIYKERRFEDSCETIALNLMGEFGASCVQVSEDGENGCFIRKVLGEVQGEQK
jgi:hypothetical protein